MAVKLSQEAKDAAVRSFDERRENHPEHVDQGTLPAGSPMTFYCRLCGWISDIMPEDYFLSTPRRICSECAGLIEHSLIDETLLLDDTRRTSS